MNKLGIYIHIPFCVRKCAYCDFLSFPGSEDEINAYLEALENEIALSAKLFGDRTVDTVFIGGGTPSVIGSERLRGIIRTLKESFHLDEDCEISCEVNPGAYDGGYITNRVSVGLQSAVNEELKTLGRIHDLKAFYETYAALRNAGVSDINVDIMFGIPGQTEESLRGTLDSVTELSPEHISAYSLIIEEGTPFYEIYGDGAGKTAECGDCADARNIRGSEKPLPDEEIERRMYHGIIEYLAARGYRQYEISNFAKPGYECRHNLKYWDRKDYLGLGLGASSMIDNVRWKNTGNVAEYFALYAEKPGLPVQDRAGFIAGKEEVIRLTAKEQMEEFMFLGLRKTQGILKSDFSRAFGKSIYEEYGDVIARYTDSGLLLDTGERIMLTPEGVDVSNVVMADFLH